LESSSTAEGDRRGEVLSLALAVSIRKKIALLKKEVEMAKDVAAVLEGLEWERDEAPLTVMLLFSGVDLRRKWDS
jgi:hypothetical protein